MRKRRWLQLALAALILVLASVSLSEALKHGWARRSLLSRLSASFGRPVEVRRFRFSMLSGLRLVADSVTVGEDPRFGQEYFLRAEQLTVGLRWMALLRGRVEFGAVSLTRPSLNLVRLEDGSWNIESWLPPANQPLRTDAAMRSGTGESVAEARRISARLSHLDIDAGRINFKRGQEKLPFALVNVTGDLEQDASGRWSIDLQANAMRVPIPLQNAGTLHLRGTVAGTSVRLRPARFVLTWEDASLADALRLVDGTDYGVRGALSAQLSAAIASPAGVAPSGNAGEPWHLQAALRLSGVHRWDLAENPADPAVDAALELVWQPGQPRLEVTRCVVEAPRSRLSAVGSLDWSHGMNPNLQFASSRVSLADLLAWRRAFLPGVADDLSVDGEVVFNAALAGWPPRIMQADASSAGAAVRTAAMPGPMRIGMVKASLQNGSLVFGPASVSLPGVSGVNSRGAARTAEEPATQGALQIEGALGPFRPADRPSDWHYRVAVSGETQRVQDLIALAGAFGRPRSSEWSAQGPVAIKLAWTGALKHGTSLTSGTLDLHDLQLTSVVLNQPLVVGAASVALKGEEWQVRLGAAQALGSHWSGSLHRRSKVGGWDFDLSADRLDPMELDRWLGPRARPGFFDRILPFASSRGDSAPIHDAVLARLAARGRLRVGEVLLAPLRVAKLDADVEIAGRRFILRRAQADFYGGRLSGDFDASLGREPSYLFRGRVDRLDLGLMANATASLAGRFAGVAEGDVTLSAHGIGLQPLAASLEGEGVLRVRNAIVRGLDLALVAPVRVGDPEPGGVTRYDTADATFHVAGGRVRMDQVLLLGRDEQLEVDGSVDFAQGLDLRVRSVPRDLARAAEFDVQDADSDTWAIGGTLDEPQLKLQTPVAGGRIGPAGARH